MAIVNISTVSDADYNRAFSYMVITDATADPVTMAPFDLTGSKLRMGVRKQAEDHEEDLLLTTENGGIVIFDALNGQFYITISKQQLSDLPTGTYVHSLVRIMSFTDQDFTYRVWSGTLTHSAGPSR